MTTALTWVTARGDGLVGAGADDGTFLLVDLQQAKIVARAACGEHVVRARAFADGRFLVARLDGQLQVRAAETLEQVAAVDTGHGRLLGLALHANGTRGATCGDDGAVRVWDTSSWTRMLELRDGNTAAHTVAFAGDHVVAGFADGFVVGWSGDGTQKVVSRQLLNSALYSVGVHPDGTRLVFGGNQGGLRAIAVGPPGEWVTGQYWSSPPKPIAVNAVEFGPDGQFVAACSDDTALFFDSVEDPLESLLGQPFHWRKPKPAWSAEFIVSGGCFVPGTDLVVTSRFDGRLQWWRDRRLVGELAPFAAGT